MKHYPNIFNFKTDSSYQLLMQITKKISADNKT